jgi:hypothetical protein
MKSVARRACPDQTKHEDDKMLSTFRGPGTDQSLMMGAEIVLMKLR